MPDECQHSWTAVKLAERLPIEFLRLVVQSKVSIAEWDLHYVPLHDPLMNRHFLQDCEHCRMAFNEAVEAEIKKDSDKLCPPRAELAAQWATVSGPHIDKQLGAHFETCAPCKAWYEAQREVMKSVKARPY